MLPWAIAVTRIHMSAENAWGYDAVIFGGALAFDFGNVILVLGGWVWALGRGRVRVTPVHEGI